MKGKVFNNRYKIIKELGKGGMAIVYEAQDLLLDRRVALKMLRPEYVHDKGFLRKFRHEAKAVARLSHPNVVNIFDIGQDNDYHYLVMENVKGRNLKEIIQERGRLSIQEALDIANQICAALSVAHENNVVHCDIKPHNILLTEDNQVKVTDFGIARAATSSTLTMTNTIMGSANYFSPEQARGGEIKTYSDIYSLGVVLYEMLTGKVPFNGDSPISVALKHIQENPKKPSLLNPEIPPEVERIVMKAMSKEPEERFKSAREMRQKITATLKNLKSNNQESDKTIVLSDDGDTKILQKVDPVEKNDKSKGNERVYLSKTDNKASNNWMKWASLIIGIIFLVTMGVFIFYQQYMEVPIVEVPDVVGLEIDEAREVAAQVGLHIEKQNDVHHPEVPESHIISQYPVGGERVRQTRVIMVTVSKGPAILKSPDLVNKTLREAEVILDNQNLKIGKKEFVYNDEYPENVIIEQMPKPGDEINVESTIDLVISKGAKPRMVSVPNVVGLRLEEAEKIIEENDLKVGEINREWTRRFIKGQVSGQQYPVGKKIPENSTINLTVSQGLINEKRSEVHLGTRVDFYVPPGARENKIEVVVIDDNGRDVAYQGTHKPGERVIQYINSVGTTTIEVYCNGDLLGWETID
ncbi:Stk1 family PASTA domain-containing Ser/Thr kinase [Halothermothrix orenii]|uniref:non-specific serine/threonine protein kinase n=1 Tax=Halothermothrix orenii (strain H 168 / OCM 544 / DSM 9562) TaxID=373903 RepID=B8CWT3_HALOH|nr:Stk1 family PASTA domain-containing Ser/Thr kinase [Halothermothrix orenii]ACL69752.1 protein kinase [Halothermothrix orenii H 168]